VSSSKSLRLVSNKWSTMSRKLSISGLIFMARMPIPFQSGQSLLIQILKPPAWATSPSSTTIQKCAETTWFPIVSRSTELRRTKSHNSMLPRHCAPPAKELSV
jgi:hypothetical protein